MRTRIEVKGLDALNRKLVDLAVAAQQAQIEAALIALQQLHSDTVAICPKNNGTLRSAIRIGAQIDVATGTVSAGLFIDGPASSRWHFVEFGTRKIPARPFIRPAFDQDQQEIVDAAARVLTAAINRAAEAGISLK